MGDARKFLATITASCPDDQWGYVWTLDGRKRKRTHWFQFQDGIEPVLELAASMGEAADVYFGVATAATHRGENSRVLSSETSGIYGLWADIDWDDSTTHKKLNLPPTKEAALEILTMVGVPPTIVVDSGHGLHAWWVFGDFWLFENDSDREAAQSLEQRWQDTIAVRAAQRGWVIDRTFDLARVLRLPGTMNHKDPTNTKPVTILSMGSTVSPSDFEDYLVAPEEISKLGLSAARTYVVGEFKLDPAAEPPRGKVDALRANHDTFGITVDRKRGDFSDQSPSSYDLALANIAASAGWSDQEIVDLLISVRRTHGDDLKLRQDYYSRTIRKAHEVTAKAQAAEQIEEAVEELEEAISSGDDEAKREKMRSVADKLSSQLNLELTNVLRYKTTPPEFALVLGGAHTLHMGGIDSITTIRRFRDLVLGSDAGVMIPGFKPDEWMDVATRIRKIAMDVDVGREGSETGSLATWIEEYLIERKPTEDMKEAAQVQAPFLDGDGLVCIFAQPFRQWIKVQRNEDIAKVRLLRLLRQIGAKPKTIPVTTVHGGRGSREAWAIPADR